MKKIGLISFVVVLLLVFGILVFASSQKDKEVVITNIKIENNTYLSDSEIIELVKSDIINLKKDSINILVVKEKLLKNQYVESVYPVFDDEYLIIKVKERYPIAYIIKNEETKFLSSDFKVIDFRKINSHLDLPVLNLKGGKKINELNNLNKLFEFLAKENVNFLKAHISEINYNTISSEVEIVLTENTINVKLGYFNDWEKNIQKLENYWLTISFKEKNQISVIDLRWDKRIIVS